MPANVNSPAFGMFMTRFERNKIFNLCSIYPVVSSEFCKGRSVVDIVKALGSGGARIFQFREKNLSCREKYELALECRSVATAQHMLMIVDDDLALALACGADGIHLGQNDFPPSVARKMGPEFLIGVSTHNAKEIELANSENIDYLNIGPIFCTHTKNVSYPAIGIEELKRLMKFAQVPFSVMGGIKTQHVRLLKTVGCKHIACVTALSEAENVAQEMQKMLKLAL